MLDDVKYMELALEQAGVAARQGEVPVGAVLVDERGQVLARACNMPARQCDPTAHAEILVLRQGAKRVGSYRLTGTTLYVTIEPCPMCAGAIVLARIKRLVYGAQDPKTGACATLYNIVQDSRLNHRLEVSRGILAEECRSLIQAFFQKRRK
ncbi:MAG: tRNA adenosine(34) deaminase TadA [Deltaproteobacteria bacterium]|nr:tRNA adenosine(34) deaminase TadA [Deltaproteobacteria bacterium]MDL1960761.1 tRNA adenosine(34) deaminase TadA [Deltaproteobacteria bacterium]